MKHLSSFFLCALMALTSIVPIQAEQQQDVVRLKGFGGKKSNAFVENYTRGKSEKGIEYEIRNWNPVTGEIRLDQGDEEWCEIENFTIGNSAEYPDSITKIEIFTTSGAITCDYCSRFTWSDPTYTVANTTKENGGGALVWTLEQSDNARRFFFRFAKNKTKVFVSHIVVTYGETPKDKDHHHHHGGIEEPQPEQPCTDCDTITPTPCVDCDTNDPEPVKPDPVDPPVIGEPTPPAPPVLEERQPTQPGHHKGHHNGNKKENPTDTSDNDSGSEEGSDDDIQIVPPTDDQPAPPGTIHVNGKNLLETLTKEELAQVKAKLGEECEKGCISWMESIPKIKKETSAECQAELRALTYNDYLQFVHCFFECILIGGSELAQGLGQAKKESEEEMLNRLMPVLLVVGPELKRLYDARDPDIAEKLAYYLHERLRFAQAAEKWKLGKYFL